MSTRLQRRRKHPVTGLYYPNPYGSPTPDSDVDLLVVMPARNEIDQSVRVDEAIEAPFCLDLIVRTSATLPTQCT